MTIGGIFTRILVWVASAVIAAMVAIGCGGSSDPAYCAKRDQIKQSVDDLDSLYVSSVPVGFVSDVEQIEKNIDEFVAATRSEFPSETEALESSVSKLRAAVDDARGQTSISVQDVMDLRADVESVGSAAQALDDKISEACS